MMTRFSNRCRSFVWHLIAVFTICSIPHFGLLPTELAGMTGREAHAAQAPAVSLSDETAYQYTGQEYDAETGLYGYGSRYYDPVIGRFVMADTVVPDITDTQALDPYSYCLNNPLKYIDPTGHNVKDKKVGDLVKHQLLNGFIAGLTLIVAVFLISL